MEEGVGDLVEDKLEDQLRLTHITQLKDLSFSWIESQSEPSK